MTHEASAFVVMFFSMGAAAQTAVQLKDDVSRAELFDLMRGYLQEDVPSANTSRLYKP